MPLSNSLVAKLGRYPAFFRTDSARTQALQCKSFQAAWLEIWAVSSKSVRDRAKKDQNRGESFTMRERAIAVLLIAFLLLTCLASWGQTKRKLIIDQDAAGPAGTDQQSILLLIQSPETEVLGITVVTGDQWLKAEVAHTLRMLELIGRTDIPVVPGAEYPLVRTKEETEEWEQQYGRVAYLGAWTPRIYHPADQVGELKEGNPKAKPVQEDAAHFLVRTVRQFPNQVTIYAGGPMTNLALAISIDPEFPSLVKELVFMGGS